MKQLLLVREESTEVETMGRLFLNENGEERILHTVEQEWRPTAPGGEPNNSCVPAGSYALLPHTRNNNRRDKVVALVNPGLGVYYKKDDRPSGVGRYMILIHAGNTHKDVVGCIAPGLGRNGQATKSSRKAMKVIMDFIDGHEAELVIQ